MSWASKTYTFSPSTTAKSAEVNQNFDDMVDGLDVAMPSGGIIIWSGATGDIPTGWFLCDGNNSTPDLRNRFVIGAGDTYAVDATGGEATHTIIENEMPSHTHIQVAHTHAETYGPKSGIGMSTGGSYLGEVYLSSGTGANIGNATPTNQATGGGAAHENRPPYYALAYMMKS